MIVDVAFEDGSVSMCRVLQELNDYEYLVEEFVCRRNGTCKFSGETQSISKDAVCGYYDVMNIEDTGLYKKVSGGVYEPIYPHTASFEIDCVSPLNLHVPF